MRLIDADALIKILQKSHESHARNSREVVLLYRDIRIINEQPTVDAVVLPCKVGDTVYQADRIRIYPLTIKKLIYDAGHIDFDESALGKSIFLTREEAEAALAERKDHGE